MAHPAHNIRVVRLTTSCFSAAETQTQTTISKPNGPTCKHPASHSKFSPPFHVIKYVLVFLYFLCSLRTSEFHLDISIPINQSPQRKKVYVQDLIRQQATLIFTALYHQNGIVYVCGSSGKMPQAIREALIEGFQNQGKMDRGDAEKYLVNMEKGGRYRQETW